jgi:hypothetical protein
MIISGPHYFNFNHTFCKICKNDLYIFLGFFFTILKFTPIKFTEIKKKNYHNKRIENGL